MMLIFDEEAAITLKHWGGGGGYDAGLIVFLNLTVVRHSQGMGNGERYKRLPNALRTLQMIPNVLLTLHCLRKLSKIDSE